LKSLPAKYKFLYILAGSGDNKYEKRLKKIAQPLVEKRRIMFTGYIKGRELLRYYNASDLFVCTSASEGASVATMEAMACELPVFSTDTGGVAEVMRNENAGLLVSCADCAEWHRELEKILTGGSPPKILHRDIAREHFDWQNIAKKFLDVYRGLN